MRPKSWSFGHHRESKTRCEPDPDVVDDDGTGTAVPDFDSERGPGEPVLSIDWTTFKDDGESKWPAPPTATARRKVQAQEPEKRRRQLRKSKDVHWLDHGNTSARRAAAERIYGCRVACRRRPPRLGKGVPSDGRLPRPCLACWPGRVRRFAAVVVDAHVCPSGIAGPRSSRLGGVNFVRFAVIVLSAPVGRLPVRRGPRSA